MKVYTSIAGAYPIISRKYGHELRKLWHELDKNRITPEIIKEQQDKVVIAIIKEQERAGMDLITDGQARWFCPISRFAQAVGLEVGGMHHYYDTNFHVRMAIAKELPLWIKPIYQEELVFLAKHTRHEILATMPSLKVLIRYTENKTGKLREDLISAYGDILLREAQTIDCKIFYEDNEGFFPSMQVISAVDARTAKRENPKKRAKEIIKEIDFRDTRPILLKPSWRLDILPRKYAYQKMRLLTQIKEELCLLLQ